MIQKWLDFYEDFKFAESADYDKGKNAIYNVINNFSLPIITILALRDSISL